MNHEEVAKSAYQAYAASTGNKNFRGEPMPKFEDLPTAIRTAWQAAVRQALAEATYCKLDLIPEERHRLLHVSRWADWTPPQPGEADPDPQSKIR